MIRSAGNPVFKMLLGIGLCSLGGALLYIYLKNRDEEEDEIARVQVVKAANKHDVSHEKEVLLQMDIADEHVPLVRGRGGVTLLMIENKTKTSISFRSSSDIREICEIRGRPSDVKEAKNLILKEIERSPIIKEEVFINDTVCGKLISGGGDGFQEIHRQSAAKLAIDYLGQNMARVLIIGNQMEVSLAKKLIEEKIREDEHFRKYLNEMELLREPRRSPTNSLSSSIYSSQNSLNSSLLSPRDKLPTNEFEKSMEVYVSAMESPSKFFIQIVGPQSKELNDLVKDMTDYYNVEENRLIHKISEPYLGQIVASIFKYDGKWYRAEIIGITPNQYDPNELDLDLHFVDYGDNAYVGKDEVHELRTDFLTLRFQAIECFLANTKSPFPNEPDTWPERSIDMFYDLTSVAVWKKLTAKVMTYRKRFKTHMQNQQQEYAVPGVELIDTCDDGVKRNIGAALIAMGFAMPINRDSASVQASNVDGENYNETIANLNDESTTYKKSDFNLNDKELPANGVANGTSPFCAKDGFVTQNHLHTVLDKMLCND